MNCHTSLLESAGHYRVHVDMWASERHDTHVTFYLLASDTSKCYDYDYYYVTIVRRRVHKGEN